MCLMSGKRDFVCRSGVNAARGWITLRLKVLNKPDEFSSELIKSLRSRSRPKRQTRSELDFL
jgi:hypothetical protein